MERDTSVIAHDLRDTSAPDRNLALELVRVTEAAALAAARWVGRGDKESADQAAVDAMRFTLHAVPMDGVVVIGEGEKDEAPMLYNGEQIGDGSPPEVDVAVDPLEGTRLTAHGTAERACRSSRWPSAAACSTRAPASTWRRSPAAPRSPTCSTSTGRSSRRCGWSRKRKGSEISDLMVIMLDRERHADGGGGDPRSRRADPLHHRRRRLGRAAGGHRGTRRRPAVGDRRDARGRAVGGGDQVAWAARCSGGCGRATTTSAQRAVEAGYDLSEVLDVDRLVAGNDVFFAATGVTDGDLLEGVRYQDGAEATTESLVMRSRSGTVRKVQATHNRVKLRELTGSALRLDLELESQSSSIRPARPPRRRRARPPAAPAPRRPASR